MNTITKYPSVLLLPTNRGLEMIATDTIVRVEAISNYSKLYFTNGKTLVVAKVLRWFEEQLPQHIRIHRTHLVNRSFIGIIEDRKYPTVMLSTGEVFHVSRLRRTQVLQQWAESRA